MKSAMQMIQENRALRELEREKTGKKVVLEFKQSLQSKIENAEMIFKRWPDTTTREDCQKAVGMTEQEIQDFKRS